MTVSVRKKFNKIAKFGGNSLTKKIDLKLGKNVQKLSKIGATLENFVKYDVGKTLPNRLLDEYGMSIDRNVLNVNSIAEVS